MPSVESQPVEEAIAVPPAQPAAASERSAPRIGVERVAQFVLLVLLLTGPALMCIHSADMGDTDIWWHLRTGEWIAAHHAVPHIELYSRPAAGTPWVAYSWLFELLVFGLFHSFGLMGLVVYTAASALLITFAIYRVVQQQGGQLPLVVLLTFACMYAMGPLYTPRPWMFTFLLFTCELGVLMHVRSTGQRRSLLLLPAIFALWANVHIQFVYGLFILGLAVAEALSSRWLAGAQRRIGAAPLLAALTGSVAATLVNPYGWRLYAVAHDLASESAALGMISELQALSFRDAIAYLVLLLALGSAAVLGRQRRLLSFEGALLAFAAFASFRSQRDVWLLAVVAAAILSTVLPKMQSPVQRPSGKLVAFAATTATLLLFLGNRVLGVTNMSLEAQLARHLPVHAIQTIADNHYAGPIFNDFNWGGYLIWTLREPVSIDGRQNVYGDERLTRNVATWAGEPDWSSNSDLAAAGVVIGPTHSPLSELLQRDSRFRLAFHDDLASVFVARR